MLRGMTGLLRLRRPAFRLPGLANLLVPLLMAMPWLGRDLPNVTVLVVLLTLVLLSALFDLLNADHDLEVFYHPAALETMAVLSRPTRALLAISLAALILGLCCFLAWLFQSWVPLGVSMASILFAAAASAGPTRLQGRGLLRLAVYWFGLFTVPMMLAGALLLSSRKQFHNLNDLGMLEAWGLLLVAVFYGSMQTGVILSGVGAEHGTNQQFGDRGLAANLGPERSIRLSWMLVVFGGSGVMVGLLLLYYQHIQLPFAIAGMVPTAVATALLGRAISRLNRQPSGEETVTALKKAAGSVSLWSNAVALSTILAAAMWWNAVFVHTVG